jgi:hypothetical protein
MAVSWIPEAISSLPPTSRVRSELNAILESLLNDVEWVLETICEYKAEDVRAKGQSGPGRKRKSDGSAEQENRKLPVKKARKSM